MAVGTVSRKALDPHGASTSVLGDLKMTVTTVVGPTSYTTGGDAVTAAQLGLTKVLHSITKITAATGTNSGAVGATYLLTNKLQFFAADATAPDVLSEVLSTTNVSGLTVTITAFGY